MKCPAVLLLVCAGWLFSGEITVQETRFQMDGKPFAFAGVSFFNALYNEAFHASPEARQLWLEKFQRYGINMLRVWAQWDNARGFVDACPECTLYQADGALRPKPLERLRALAVDAEAKGMGVQLVLFSQESWRENLRLSDAASDRAVAELARAMLAHRNVTFQIWNEMDYRTLDYVKIIRSIDPKRLLTNSPGFAGVLTGMRGEEQALDYLTPHTTRQHPRRHWVIAPKEIEYLLTKFGKPVVDDEPARNGTSDFGGPRVPTDPMDHILQIAAMWRLGAGIVYHHDMFQTGAGSKAVPPSGIPDPEFSRYHRVVFEFIAKGERYR